MSEISELESRITAALDRITAGLAQMGDQDAGTLAEDLASEREANAQLEERVKAIKEKQETMVSSLQEEVAAFKQALGETDSDLQRLRSVNAELRESNTALRTANANGLPDSELVNGGMAAEIEALRTLEAGNRAEIDRALGLLEPMLEEAANA